MRISILCATVCVISTLGLHAQTPTKSSVAVIEFQTSGGISPTDVAALTNRFRGLLVETKAFTLVEREKMNDILKAQDFNLSDACNTNECAVQVGQLLGVQQMIAGDLGKVGETYTIDLRLIDVETGEIRLTRRRDYRGNVDGLLQKMEEIAESFAEAAAKKVQNKGTTTQKPASPAANRRVWYLVGGAALVGGGALFLITKSGSKDPPGIPTADWPPQ